MHKIKEMLMNELYEYEEKAKKMSGGKLSQNEMDRIHKLTDTVKNIDKIEMLEDGGYSEESAWMADGKMYGTSYARGRGRNARRDSMGRYIRDDGYSENYDGGSSYARGGQGGRGSNIGGRVYSRNDAKEHMIHEMQKMMKELEPREQQVVQDCISRIK